MAYNRSIKSGFTLVELSIVLVIIGLLIGGILVGQSLIESAKVNSIIKQFAQIDIAIDGFKTKYRFMPGDSPRNDANGDGDGILENTATNANTATTTNAAFNYEIANFWRHLQQNNFLTSQYPTFSNLAATGIRAGTHIPRLSTDKSTGIVPFVDQTIGKLYYLKTRFLVANFEGSTNSAYVPGTAAVQPTVSLRTLMAIDSKIDDGIAYTVSWGIIHPELLQRQQPLQHVI